MTDARKVIGDAAASIRAEAESLRAEIAEEEQKLKAKLAPKRLALTELEEALSRLTKADRAPKGQNRQLVARYIREHPGATATVIAEKEGIPQPSVYAALKALKSAGDINKSPDGKGFVSAGS